MLENERRCRELLGTLAGQTEGLGSLESELHIQYLLAKRAHDHSQETQHLNGNGPALDWWETLGKMQYISTLMEHLQELTAKYTTEEIEAEIQHAEADELVYKTALRTEVLGAMAKAEHSARGKTDLTHNIPAEPPNAAG